MCQSNSYKIISLNTKHQSELEKFRLKCSQKYCVETATGETLDKLTREHHKARNQITLRLNEGIGGPSGGQKDSLHKLEKEHHAAIFDRKDYTLHTIREIEPRDAFIEAPCYYDASLPSKYFRWTQLNRPHPVFINDETCKHTIQQPSRTSCTTTCLNMLLCDMGLHDRYIRADQTLWTKDGELEKRIESVKLTPIETKLRLESNIQDAKERYHDLNQKVVDAITQLITKNGSAILSLGNHGHVVVIDSISLDTGVRIREPWSGIDITLTLDAFSKEMRYHSDEYEFEDTKHVHLHFIQIREYQHPSLDQNCRKIKEKLQTLSRDVDQFPILEAYCAEEKISLEEYLAWDASQQL